jgi:hypothetical protein
MADLDKSALVIYGVEREFAQTLENTLTQALARLKAREQLQGPY